MAMELKNHSFSKEKVKKTLRIVSSPMTFHILLVKNMSHSFFSNPVSLVTPKKTGIEKVWMRSHVEDVFWLSFLFISGKPFFFFYFLIEFWKTT